MEHIKTRRRSHIAASVMIIALAGVLLAACGGSSKAKGSSASTSAASTSSAHSTGATGPSGRFSKRFAATRECLQKNGITLPQRPAGQRSPTGPEGRFGGPRAQLPKGVTRAQLQAALKKCGAATGSFLRRGRLNSASLHKFAECMRKNGVNVPEPNTSGNGPIFNTHGLNTNSTAFKDAEAKCRSQLGGSFQRAPNGPPPGPAPSAG